MRPIALTSLLLLAATACGPAKVAGTIEGDGDSGLSVETDGADGADGSDGSDGSGWTGGFDLVAGTGGEGGEEYFSCEGDMTLQADEAGNVTGDGSCEVEWVGTVSASLEGTFTAAGDLAGTLTVSAYGQEIPVEAIGGANDEDSVSAYLDGELELGGYLVVIGGGIQVERD
jgi:hypothetical protein